MSKVPISYIFIFLISCFNMEYSYFQPANPPVGTEVCILDNDDFFLLFRSSNQNNPRFCGFLIFVDSSIDELLLRDTIDEADYMLEQGIDERDYNLGINTPIVVLFSDDINYDPSGQIDDEYTVMKRFSKEGIEPGDWIAIRTYLCDDSFDVLEISSPSNSVIISENIY